MIEPVKTEDDFSAISADFNESAKKFANSDGLTLDGLLTKFNILWKFKAETPTQQEMLVHGLFDGGTQILRKCTESSGSIATSAQSAQAIFNFLTTKEQLPFLPEKASTELVDIALSLIKKAENTTYNYGSYNRNNSDPNAIKNELVALAKVVVTYAEKAQEPKATTGVAAAKLAPPKRLSMQDVA